MDLSIVSYDLVFRHPFGVSSNTRRSTTSVFVKISSSDCSGFGEACLPAYLGETETQTIAFLKLAEKAICPHTTERPLDLLLDEIDALDEGCNAAKAAVDMALHDLYGKVQGVSFRKMKNIKDPGPFKTSFTIGIDTEEKLQQKIDEASEFHILKIKAGTNDDKSLIRTIRKFTNKPLYVDVNQGWTDKEMVLDMLFWMHEQNVILAEQPMPTGFKSEMQWVTERSPVPTFADESVKRYQDLVKLDGAFNGINIKLMKCTGLREALKMIAYCGDHNIKIMLGCMAESSCATTAMAHLASFADYVDLDAPLLYTNDPFQGISFSKGYASAPGGVGIGVKPATDLFA